MNYLEYSKGTDLVVIIVYYVLDTFLRLPNVFILNGHPGWWQTMTTSNQQWPKDPSAGLQSVKAVLQSPIFLDTDSALQHNVEEN